MKFVLLLFTISFILFFLGCEEEIETKETITFSKTFGGSASDLGYDVRQTEDGGYIIVGQTSVNNNVEVWLIKINEYGELLWDKTFGGNLNDSGKSVELTVDGGYIIGATTNYSLLLIKSDKSGQEEWSKLFENSISINSNNASQTHDSGYVIVGYTSSEFGNKAIVIKSDANGVEQWRSEYCPETQESGSCFGSSIDVLPDGHLVVVGTKSTYNDYGEGPSYGFVIMTDDNGNELWSHLYEDTRLNHVPRVVVHTSDHGLVLTGGMVLPLLPTYYFLAKLDSEGKEIWWKELNVGEYDVSLSVVETTDGGFLISGVSWFSSEGDNGSIFLDKTNSEGNLQWRKLYDHENPQFAYVARETQDGGFIIVGHRYSKINGSNDILIIKTDAEGNL